MATRTAKPAKPKTNAPKSKPNPAIQANLDDNHGVKPSKPKKGRKPTPDLDKTYPVGTDRGTVFAPASQATHTTTADDQRRRQAAKTLGRDRLKAALQADKDSLFAMLIGCEVKPSELKPAKLAQFNAAQLSKVAKAHGIKGYSGLSKDELVEFLSTGVKPAPKTGSTREKRAKVSAAKKNGLVSGPISSLKVADLDAIIRMTDAGQKVAVDKPTPNEGTADWLRNLLRNKDGKGYPASVTAKSKALFGKSVSALKVAELRKLCQALGLTK